MVASSRCIGIVKEYEDVLAGAKKSLPTIYFSDKTNQKTTLDFLVYVFEGILGWDAEDVRGRLDRRVIKKLRLERAVNCLEFPPELDPEEDLWYISCLLYPDKYRYDRDRHSLATYEKVLSENLPRFPKWFFSDYDGEVNAALCLNYALSRYFPATSIPELYEVFASPKANSLMNEFKLSQPCALFFGSPLDMLHNSLCSEERSDYHYYRHKVAGLLDKAGLPSKISPASSYEGMRRKYLEVKKGFEEAFNGMIDKYGEKEEVG